MITHVMSVIEEDYIKLVQHEKNVMNLMGESLKKRTIKVIKVPRKIQDKEINDMRRIIEIMLQHSRSAQKRMWDFCIGSVESKSKKQEK